MHRYLMEEAGLRDLLVIMMCVAPSPRRVPLLLDPNPAPFYRCTPAQKKEIQHISPTLNAFLLKPVLLRPLQRVVPCFLSRTHFPPFPHQLRKKELLNIVMNHSGSKRGGYALEVPTNSNQVRSSSCRIRSPIQNYCDN